jgi:hypothetical protein
MNGALRTWWTTGLTAILAALYGWIGLAGHDVYRALGLTGALLVVAALPAARRSRPLAVILLVLGAVPLAVAAWWSIAAPLVGLLALPLGWAAIRTQAALTTRPKP